MKKSDICEVCGMREGENHDLRCNPRMTDISEYQLMCLSKELEGYKNGNRDLHEENQALRAELERMRPVVEAACPVRDYFVNAADDDRWLDADEIDRVQGDLIDTVDAYRNSKEQA